MTTKTQRSTSNGIGFGGLLTLLFVGLKLTGNIDWSWWWVLAPMWAPIIGAFVIVGVCIVIAALFGK